MISVIRGETKPWVVDLLNEDGTARDITGYTRVVVKIANTVSKSIVLSRDTNDYSTDITIQDNPAQVTVNLTEAESGSLNIVTHMADIWTQVDNVWSASVPVFIQVSEGLGEPASVVSTDVKIYTPDFVIRYVRGMLGHPTVQVELTDEHYNIAIDSSLRLFNQFLAERQIRTIFEQTGGVNVQLEDSVRGVLEVKMVFPESQRILAQANIFEILYRMVFPQLPIGEWYMLKSFYEMYQRTRGTEPDWRYDEQSKILFIDAWSGPYDIMYIVAKNLTLSSLEHGKEGNMHKFLETVLAYSKIILGRIRSKFGQSLPAPGGALVLDGPQLLQEAEVTLKDVTDNYLRTVTRTMVSPVMWG